MTESNSSPWGDLFADASTDVWDPGNAHLDQWAFTEWARADGFRQAGEILVRATRELDHLESDRVVFPIVFLYRHSVELKLKELLAVCRSYLADPSEIPLSHDLVQLWELVLADLSHCPAGRTETYFDEIDATVRQLQAVDDKAATAFRYVRQRDGSRSLPRDLVVIDPTRVGERLERALTIFDGWMEGIGVAADARSEMRAEYADYEDDVGEDW